MRVHYFPIGGKTSFGGPARPYHPKKKCALPGEMIHIMKSPLVQRPILGHHRRRCYQSNSGKPYECKKNGQPIFHVTENAWRQKNEVGVPLHRLQQRCLKLRVLSGRAPGRSCAPLRRNDNIPHRSFLVPGPVS